MKTTSCKYIQSAVYFAPDELRHCCKRFFVDGKIQGDVQIMPVENPEDLTIEKLHSAKQDLVDAINRGEKTACFGCPFLETKEWAPVSQEKIEIISLEHHSHCNMRCTYCSETYYGGLFANYDLIGFLKALKEKDLFSKDLLVAWGGGEPTMLKEFDEMYDFINEEINPWRQRFFTNSINYSERIAKGLAEGKNSITTSVDAGTIETFKKVRGVNQYKKVLENIAKYCAHSDREVIIKYIFTQDNCSIEEIDHFVKDLKSHGINQANFLISVNFKDETLDLKRGLAVIYLHWLLCRNGAKSCAYDDHARPRVGRVAELLLSGQASKDMDAKLQPAMDELKKYSDVTQYGQIICWGASEYATMLLDDSVSFKHTEISFYVDNDKKKQGTTFRGRPVLAPSKIIETDLPILIASSFFHNEISQEIKQMGVSEKRVISNFFI